MRCLMEEENKKIFSLIKTEYFDSNDSIEEWKKFIEKEDVTSSSCIGMAKDSIESCFKEILIFLEVDDELQQEVTTINSIKKFKKNENKIYIVKIDDQNNQKYFYIIPKEILLLKEKSEKNTGLAKLNITKEILNTRDEKIASIQFEKLEENELGGNFPKLIHFIWAGGNRHMPQDNISTLIDWSIKNSEWTTCLWVDRQTDEFKKILVYYEEEIKEILKNKNILFGKFLKQFKLLDIEEHNLRNKFVSYEIDNLNPNYGASSDILRYKILYKFGGAYFDTDVLPCEELNKIEEINKSNSSFIYLDHWTQNNKVLENFEVYNCGNDSFICPSKSPFMSDVSDKLEKNYFVRENKIFEIISLAYGGDNKKWVTINRTGPTLINYLIKEKSILDPGDNTQRKINNILIKTLRNTKTKFTEYQGNDANWLGIPIKKITNFELVKKILKKTILFELEHFKIIRADDHVSDFIKSTSGKYNIDKKIIEEAQKEIISLLKLIQFPEGNIYVQSTGKHDTVNEFFENFTGKTNFVTLFKLENEQLEKALDTTLSLWFFAGFLEIGEDKILENIELYLSYIEEKLDTIIAICIKIQKTPFFENNLSQKNYEIFEKIITKKIKEYNDFIEKFKTDQSCRIFKKTLLEKDSIIKNYLEIYKESQQKSDSNKLNKPNCLLN